MRKDVSENSGAFEVRPIGERLIAKGIISADDLEKALSLHNKWEGGSAHCCFGCYRSRSCQEIEEA